MERSSSKLRKLLEKPGPIVVPCAFDCVSARIVEMAGFSAVMHGGFNTAASLLGLPDVGIITMSEMLYSAQNIAEAVQIPLIADIDDGFGQPINVARTIRRAIRARLAGVYMEDQLFPKRCPTLGGGGIVSEAEMIAKIRAARRVAMDEDPDFLLIARTHAARAVNLDEALKRGPAYAREGADLIWVDLGYDELVYKELHAIVEVIAPYAPVVANMTENVGRPLLTTQQLHEMGFKLIVYPLTLILTAAQAMSKAMRCLMENGTTSTISDRIMQVQEFCSIVKLNLSAEVENQLGNSCDYSDSSRRDSNSRHRP